MRILLIGYGKMGKAIEKIALDRRHTIAGRIDLGDKQPFPQADVAIEFSQPEAAVDNIIQCLDQKIPIVCGTTGWLEHKDRVEKECSAKNGTLFYSSNYSLGVNIFFKLNEYLATLMERFTEYDVSIDETHHTQKKDAPSGTALTLAQGAIKQLTRKKNWAPAGMEKPGDITIHSFRIDPAAGIHRVSYSSAIDDIEIKHTAHSREGFALGAVLAAEWIIGKKGILGMNDFLPF
jgi:4-hydroxy-tetrahydrodipicolinate reductase